MFHVKPRTFAQLFTGWVFLFISCNDSKTADTRMGNFLYYVYKRLYLCMKDNNSVLFIYDDECSECLEEHIDSGQIYIPDYVAL